MKNLKVSVKLIVSFSIIIALTAIVGVVGIIGMSNINAAKQDMYYTITTPMPYLGKVEENLQSARVFVREMVMHSMADNQSMVDSSWNNVNVELGKMNDNAVQFRNYTEHEQALRLFNDAMNRFNTELAPVVNSTHQASKDGSPEALANVKAVLLPD